MKFFMVESGVWMSLKTFCMEIWLIEKNSRIEPKCKGKQCYTSLFLTEPTLKNW